MEGPLSKWTNVIEGWQYRWFVLDENTGLLSYYTSKEKMMRGSRRGCVRLKGAIVGIDDEDDSTFTITCDNKMFHFQARDSDERDKWVRGLEDTILRHSQPQKALDSILPTTLADFDRRMQESDAYLQILIEQLQVVESKIGGIEDEATKQQYINIKVIAEAMIESVKHSIMLLQIAKNQTLTSTSPLTTQPMIIVSTDSQTSSVDLEITPRSIGRAVGSGLEVIEDREVVDGVEEGRECSEAEEERDGGSVFQDVMASSPPLSSSVIPATSYSSSDDEEFLDATEEYDSELERDSQVKVRDAAGADVRGTLGAGANGDTLQAVDPPRAMVSLFPGPNEGTNKSPIRNSKRNFSRNINRSTGTDSPTPCKKSVSSKSKGITSPCSCTSCEVETLRQCVNTNRVNSIQTLYDEEEEDEPESMEEHGSLIMHLLSQLKIGMDLTKVTLPTFILEKRSLLEMYADFFAHPHLFANIGDYTTPEQRMVQVLRWYLSAFHAGRRGDVAKKPYNPILGEIFQCFWEVEPAADLDNNLCDEGGPVPWANKNHVTFIAEQVSHHPPVSSFYAEHQANDICVDGHIWTKSKFLGLSIGVEMVGQACLSVIRHGEEYLLSFPNGYGRSIFNVPWVELGGKASITCAKTGYYANIEFLTKPFYGGKRHQIVADAFGPWDKKPFLHVDGAWNGVMVAKYKDGTMEPFVDTKSMPIIPKRVLPLDKQKNFESRKLWQHVTQALKERDVERATHFKHKLEHRQREEAKYRKEHGLNWDTRYFHESGEHWIYENPLQKRLGNEQ